MIDTPHFRKALGQVIRTRRERLGLSRKELAAGIEGSVSHVKAIEVGNRNPTITVFILIARAMRIHETELLHEVLQMEALLAGNDQQ